MSDVHLACWSAAQRGKLIITDSAGREVASFPITRDKDRPCPQMLWETGWSAYPGSEWEEEPPGEWSVAVFNQDSIGQGG